MEEQNSDTQKSLPARESGGNFERATTRVAFPPQILESLAFSPNTQISKMPLKTFELKVDSDHFDSFQMLDNFQPTTNHYPIHFSTSEHADVDRLLGSDKQLIPRWIANLKANVPTPAPKNWVLQNLPPGLSFRIPRLAMRHGHYLFKWLADRFPMFRAFLSNDSSIPLTAIWEPAPAAVDGPEMCLKEEVSLSLKEQLPKVWRPDPACPPVDSEPAGPKEEAREQTGPRGERGPNETEEPDPIDLDRGSWDFAWESTMEDLGSSEDIDSLGPF
jgi:hypothetical protein